MAFLTGYCPNDLLLHISIPISHASDPTLFVTMEMFLFLNDASLADLVYEGTFLFPIRKNASYRRRTLNPLRSGSSPHIWPNNRANIKLGSDPRSEAILQALA